MFPWLAFATPEPLVPPSQVDESLVFPGVWGFVATAFVAIAAVVIILDMVRRVRRVTYRAEIRERIEAERVEAERAEAEQGGEAEQKPL